MERKPIGNLIKIDKVKSCKKVAEMVYVHYDKLKF